MIKCHSCSFRSPTPQTSFLVGTFFAVSYSNTALRGPPHKSTGKRTDVLSQTSCIYTQIFSPKKTGFSPIKDKFQNFFEFVYLYYMQLFSADPKIFSKKIYYFCP